MKHIKYFNESVGTEKINLLIKRKLDGEKLSEKEFFQLHNWMMENDDEYRKSVDKQICKDLKKYLPKDTKVSIGKEKSKSK